MNRKRMLILAAAILVIVAAFFMVWKQKSSGTEAIAVGVESIKTGEINRVVTGSGEVVPASTEIIPLTQGVKVRKVYAGLDAVVKKGQKIAELDSGDLSFLLKKAELNAVQLRADLKELKKDSSDYLIQSKERQIRLNQLDIDSLKKRLAQFTIKTTISGTITRTDLKTGQILSSGNRVEIADLTSLEFRMMLPQEDASFVQVGQSAKILLKGLSSPLEAKVSRVGQIATLDSLNGKTPKVEVLLGFDGVIQGIRGGYQGDGAISAEKLTGVLVTKRENIRLDEEGKIFVYLLKDGKAKKTEVVTGSADDYNIELKEGIRSGDMIIENPPANLQDGSVVSSRER